MMRRTLRLAVLASVLLGPALAQAQGLFSPRAYVDNKAITEYEVQQRAKFIDVLGGSPDPEKAALDALIDDRIYQITATAQKLSVTDAQIKAGIADFAGRAETTPDAFLARMRGAGVAEQTVRDFVTSGLLWRDVVRNRFASRVRITEAEIDRVMSAESRRPGLEVALSEIILPNIPEYAEQTRRLREVIDTQVNTPELFAEAARRFSASASRERGGALDWLPKSNLPPVLAGVVDRLSPGQMSGPIEVPNAIAYFLLRGVREGARPSPSSLKVDYAQLLIPGTRDQALAQAARLRTEVDECDDLYDTVRGLDPALLTRDTMQMTQVPADIGLALARLDPGEVSTDVTRSGTTVFLMLCSRTPRVDPAPTRDQIRGQLLDQRLGVLARNYLAELKAAAIIRRP